MPNLPPSAILTLLFMTAQFQISGTPLLPGVTLIEASAGTGKTYTIAGIFLRLILELHLPIESILAVTYTEAATEELRDRIRKRLREALEELRVGHSKDPIVSPLLDLTQGEIAQAIRELDCAILNFDQAQIFTIHGFCHRVLRNNAFESGVLFDMELITDPTPLFEQIAQDFWRLQFYSAGPLPSRLALTRKRSPETWTDLLNQIRNHPDLRILPDADPDSLEAITAALEDAFDQIRQAWDLHKEEITHILQENKSLSRAKDKKKGFHPDYCPQLLADFAQLCSNLDEAEPACLEAIECLSSSGIKARTKPKGTAPTHQFFELCEAFLKAANRFFFKLDSDFIEFARRQLPARKARQNVLTFDDLLIRLRQALKFGSNGIAPLTRELRRQYQAALIDEFQDTDPVQYEIFQTLFATDTHRLFFIGDPKQAIYGFRGADVFTYLEAAQGATHRYTLATNYRSEKPLLDGLNHLFSNPDPFLNEAIQYQPVQPPASGSSTQLLSPSSEASLQCRLLPPTPSGDPLSQVEAEAQILRALVQDIAALLASGASIQSNSSNSSTTRPLTSRDIAILVRSNSQAAKLPDLLRAQGIKSVLQSDRSVFDTPEATELLRLLEGILEPNRPTALKTALSTTLIGLSAAELCESPSDPTQHQTWLDQFLLYRKLWENSGFIILFRKFLVDQSVRERLVQWPGGERRLTNLLHLAELLHSAESQQRLGPESLCAWLLTQQSSQATKADEHQLRLESDEDAVVICTIHKSKGLEYPVVFCPFLWKPGDSKRRKEILFHDPDNDHLLTLDLREEGTDEHDHLAGLEIKAESLRLAYVALTRAKNRCYVYAGAIKSFPDSPLSHLLASADAEHGFQKLAAASDAIISVSEIQATDAFTTPAPVPVPSQPLQARPFTAAIPNTTMMASFTGLLSGRHEEETPDRDAFLAEQPALIFPEPAPLAPLGEFQRGPAAGLFFHSLLEELDFQAPGEIESQVTLHLQKHGIPQAHWKAPLCENIRQLLELPLGAPAEGLRLNAVTKTERLSEVEFCHPIKSLTPAQLRSIFEGHHELPNEFPESLGRLHFNPVEGYMRGFIDLLFHFKGRYYLIDWKSNWLGNHLSDYDDAGVRACMLGHSYYLQYHLYTLATDLFLSQRLPGYDYQTHFGGVFYVFLRGIDPTTPTRAIHQDRPTPKLVSALRKALLGSHQSSKSIQPSSSTPSTHQLTLAL